MENEDIKNKILSNAQELDKEFNLREQRLKTFEVYRNIADTEDEKNMLTLVFNEIFGQDKEFIKRLKRELRSAIEEYPYIGNDIDKLAGDKLI